MRKGLLVAGMLFMLFCMAYSCKKVDTVTDEDKQGSFDKTTMLTYYADDLIIPGYTAMIEKMSALETSVNAFLNAPTVDNQAKTLAAYKEAHIQYTQVAPFQFGPAETALLDLYMNFSGGLDYNFNTSGALTGFSIDTATIENNIASGSYTFTAMTRNSFYSQGFPALNYLLFEPQAAARLSAGNAAARAKYTRDVVTRMKELCTKVSSEWTTYRATFIANTQTNVGSPIGNIINQLALQMDLLKGPRIGWPLGKQSNGIVFANKCEAYYSGYSSTLALNAITGLKRTYTANNSGKGLSDYVVALNNASLNTDVLAQFDITIEKLKAIPDPLSGTLTTSPTVVDAAYKEIQKLLTLLKTDVASATAVQITFMDNDGD